jgi:hypothetical protein
LKDTRFYLDLASFLVTEKKVAPAADLLRFYLHESNLTRKMTLERLNIDDQTFVVVNIAEALASLDNSRGQTGSAPEQLETLRNQVVDASPVLLDVRFIKFLLSFALTIFLPVQALVKSKPLRSRSWAACEVLLRACIWVSAVPGSCTLYRELIDVLLMSVNANQIGVCQRTLHRHSRVSTH